MSPVNEPVWSITEVNAAVRELIENSLTPFWLTGEVGTLNIHSSGHVYLTLKDRDCQLRATFFNGATHARAMNMAVGMRLEAYGRLTVYTKRGDYQFNIQNIRPAGAGDLQRQFEEIKRKLAAEGLFDPARKLPLPAFPRTIGIVTSPDGAAVRDFIRIALRRAPWLAIKVFPAVVQGDGTAASVCKGIAFFNRPEAAVDVIVVARGGGSMEDLWGFNDESLARAIAASTVPVVSAIGHEIDFTIADFAASCRAATPSAAAELVAPERGELLKRLDAMRNDLKNQIELALLRAKRRFEQSAQSYVFREPAHLLRHNIQTLDELSDRLRETVRNCRERNAARLAVAAGKLSALDPGAVLKRGYAILETAAGAIAVSKSQLHRGDAVRAKLHDGTVDLTVR